MNNNEALILSTAAAAGAAYLLIRKFNEAPDTDGEQGALHMEDQNGGIYMEQSQGYSDARGYRNNNPLNIRYSDRNNWQGKVLANTDGSFEQFIDMAYGFRAALYLFRKYIRQGHNTVEKIVYKWAPPSENHSDKYLAFVVSKTQLDPHMPLKAGNADVLKRLAHAMAWYENGSAPKWTDIEEGWKLL